MVFPKKLPISSTGAFKLFVGNAIIVVVVVSGFYDSASLMAELMETENSGSFLLFLIVLLWVAYMFGRMDGQERERERNEKLMKTLNLIKE